jgi:hypothetical protein
MANRGADMVTAGVHDGVAVRCLACSVHECGEPLRSQQDRFCYTHRELKEVCYVRDCRGVVGVGFRTCEEPTHRAHEEASIAEHSGMFQLRERLERAVYPERLARPAEEGPSVKGSANRRYSNNEQLFVRCCGIIISRATFYGSEGVSGVSVRRMPGHGISRA